MDGLECDVREIGYDVREIWIYCICIILMYIDVY